MVSTWKARMPPFKQTRNTHPLTHDMQGAFSRIPEPQHVSSKMPDAEQEDSPYQSHSP